MVHVLGPGKHKGVKRPIVAGEKPGVGKACQACRADDNAEHDPYIAPCKPEEAVRRNNGECKGNGEQCQGAAGEKACIGSKEPYGCCHKEGQAKQQKRPYSKGQYFLLI